MESSLAIFFSCIITIALITSKPAKENKDKEDAYGSTKYSMDDNDYKDLNFNEDYKYNKDITETTWVIDEKDNSTAIGESANIESGDDLFLNSGSGVHTSENSGSSDDSSEEGGTEDENGEDSDDDDDESKSDDDSDSDSEYDNDSKSDDHKKGKQEHIDVHIFNTSSLSGCKAQCKTFGPLGMCVLDDSGIYICICPFGINMSKQKCRSPSEANHGEPAKSSAPTTVLAPTIVLESTTIVAPTTVSASTTVQASTTVSAPITVKIPTTVPAPITVPATTTVSEPTTVSASTAVRASTTVSAPITVKIPTTVSAPITVPATTTVSAPTTLEVPTSFLSPTIIPASTTASAPTTIPTQTTLPVPTTTSEPTTLPALINEGCLTEPDYNYLSNDVIAPFSQEDWKSCRDIATRVAHAHYWTFRFSDKLCYLKSSKENRVLEGNAVFISGNANCRESQQHWRDDGKCGNNNLLNGELAQCNPNGTGPCCSNNGWCGSTPKHCNCPGCINYGGGSGDGGSADILSEDWRKWRKWRKWESGESGHEDDGSENVGSGSGSGSGEGAGVGAGAGFGADCIEMDTDYFLNDIVPVNQAPRAWSWQECSFICRNKYAEACKFWTFLRGKCLAKSSKDGKRKKQGAISGSYGCVSNAEVSGAGVGAGVGAGAGAGVGAGVGAGAGARKHAGVGAGAGARNHAGIGAGAGARKYAGVGAGAGARKHAGIGAGAGP